MRDADMKRRSLIAGAGWLALPKSGLAADARPKVAIKTGKGAITVELAADKAPLTSANFLHYVDTGKYDGGSFFRAARTPGSMTEGSIVGAPGPRSHPYPPIAHESTTLTGLRHLAGTLSLGRFAPGTATSNFFICASDEPYLDAHPHEKGDNLGYAAFGRVISGMAVVRKILAAHTNPKAPFPEQRGQWLDPPIPILSMRRVA
jgi:peptidyl-prolyl cis-trans isomerase A (cyclophilin A)